MRSPDAFGEAAVAIGLANPDCMVMVLFTRHKWPMSDEARSII
jgi:hypothetical protein